VTGDDYHQAYWEHYQQAWDLIARSKSICGAYNETPYMMHPSFYRLQRLLWSLVLVRSFVMITGDLLGNSSSQPSGVSHWWLKTRGQVLQLLLTKPLPHDSTILWHSCFKDGNIVVNREKMYNCWRIDTSRDRSLATVPKCPYSCRSYNSNEFYIQVAQVKVACSVDSHNL
jgi:hypothetical protein